MFSSNDWTGAFIVAGLFCAMAGWAFIEFILWLFSFVHFSFG